MATRKDALVLTTKRFMAFWSQFKRSKRGLVGVSILAFFVVLALVSPFIAQLDPYAPEIKGSYPAGTNPKIAVRLCYPSWQRYLPGGENLVENIYVVKDHEFSSLKSFEEWKNESVNCEVKRNLTGGSQEDGCIEVSCQTSSVGFAQQATARISKSFEYPFTVHPEELWVHISAFTETPPTNDSFPVTINLLLKRNQGVQVLRSFEPKAESWGPHTAHHYVKYKESKDLREMFPEKGNYTFILEVQIDGGLLTDGEITVYLDNLDVIIYGNCYGLLGTDRGVGATGGHPRDLFTTLVYGTRISLLIGLLSALISTFLGLFLGLLSGFVGGVTDQIIMRLADVLLVIPTLPLLIVLAMVLNPSIWNLIFLISLMGWMGFARQTRSMTLSLRERSFVEAAKASGAGTLYIVNRHILPNVFALVYVTLATAVPGAIVAEASLSWLGLFDPNVVSWGRILYEFNLSHLLAGVSRYWFWVIPPGVVITLLAVSFILIGFALDEILNPRLRKRR